MGKSKKVLYWNKFNTDTERVNDLIRHTVQQCGECPELENLSSFNYQVQPYENEEDLYYSCSIINI